MEELSKKVENILNNFLRQELGNRLSEYAWLALKQILLNEIKNYKIETDKSKKKSENIQGK